MNNSFCVLPWVSLATDTQGNIVPCCVSTQKLKKHNGDFLNLGTDDLEEIVNSDDFVKLRQDMLAGNTVAGCQECYYNEKYGSSQRLQFNALFNVENPKDIITASPKYLDIRPGNLCNLKCRSCTPDASSQFAKETNLLQTQGMHEFHEFRNQQDQIWYTTETFYKNINKALETATDIYLTGGEPSIIQSNLDMLHRLVETQRCKEIKLTISTNLTNTNTKFFDLLSKFKNVMLYVSIDGYDQMNEYLRYPSSWSTIVTNLHYLLNLDKNIQVVLTPVVQITNLNKIVDLLEYIDSLNKEYTKKIYVYPINLETPDYLDMLHLPVYYKMSSCERLLSWLEKSNNQHFDFVKNKAMADAEYKSHLERFVRYNRLLDKHRGHSLETVNPELVEMLRKENLW